MPITAIALLSFCDMACSLTLAPLCQLLSPAGLKHGRTIPSAALRGLEILHCGKPLT
jgi:hypothetical protein